MSAAGIKLATTTASSRTADNDDVRINTTTTTTVTNENCAVNANSREGENSSFCHLSSLKEQQVTFADELQQNKVPLENSEQGHQPDDEEEEALISTTSSARDLNDFGKNHVKPCDVDSSLSAQLSPGLNLLQQTAAASSPPPHSYRHSRAYRHFKNPPQPHMCIRTTTEAGEELFINVLSWTRIVIPQEPSDPIPLYGGMRVPPGSPRSPPIVFAVMANPEVLKDSGRHSKDPEERRAMVELMCDFVEAMNPGVKLVRNAVILKDRDISGELKDVWNAVQIQRDREREEQMILQRQQHQQHFHNLTTVSTNGLNTSSTAVSSNNSTSGTTQQMFPKSIHSDAGNDAIVKNVVDGGTPPRSRKLIQEVQSDCNTSNISVEVDNVDSEGAKTSSSQVSLASLADHLDNKMLLVDGEQYEQSQPQQHNNQKIITNDALSNGNSSKESLEECGNIVKNAINNQLNAINCNNEQNQQTLSNGSVTNCNDVKVLNVTSTGQQQQATTCSTNVVPPNPAQNNPPQTTAAIPAPQHHPTKKEKLGGFLPNGCIFPRFTKNNKHKDKDKESKTKDKEKNVLLSALKKSKDKKSNANTATATAALAANHDEKNTSSNINSTTATSTNCNQTNNKQQKNCLQQLECGVQKLDLNHHHPHHIADNNTNNTTNTTTNKNNTSSGVGVH